MFRLYCLVTLSLLLVLCGVMGAHSSDFARTLIVGCPEVPVDEGTGLPAGSMLTLEDSLAIFTPGFDGDTLRLLVIPVEYTVGFDARRHKYSREVLDTLFFSEGVRPTGSVVEYFDEVSYGQLTVSGDVTDWYDEGSYPYSCYYLHTSVIPALDPLVDYSQYDGNHDGIVDGVVFVVAGNALQDTQDYNDP